ncbi:hypothetical protein HMPREF0946_00924 [Fusobacterium vincentii 3_1_36A2]|jgi:hypothetical protein|uniref:Uncharacterized protein n=1 Tax=Fusobacterium vincentii 3_1_36A2 TaxID=469604 RepID=C7XPV8_FUSVC|nr:MULTISPECIES: hypothetical protein [Fusobacterium]EEU32851.1 hypothetical protein HMPREF0946_00924 [Fusobacterium vincentii 3_1_36A2]
MFFILYVVGVICILRLIIEASKLPLKFRVLISIILVVVIFSFLKEVTGASSILEMFSLNFLKNLKNLKN